MIAPDNERQVDHHQFAAGALSPGAISAVLETTTPHQPNMLARRHWFTPQAPEIANSVPPWNAALDTTIRWLGTAEQGSKL